MLLTFLSLILAQQLQGMTLDKLELTMKDFQGDYLQNSPGYSYMLWTRVLNLDSILIHDIDLDIETSLKFFNNQDHENLAWEKEWIEDANSVDDNVCLKYKDKVALINELGKAFKDAKNIILLANADKKDLIMKLCKDLLFICNSMNLGQNNLEQKIAQLSVTWLSLLCT